MIVVPEVATRSEALGVVDGDGDGEGGGEGGDGGRYHNLHLKFLLERLPDGEPGDGGGGDGGGPDLPLA